MKNGWKKTLSLLLCLVLLAGLFPAALAEGESCTLEFSVDGGNYLDPITAEKDSEITLPKAVWDYHYFLGWALDPEGGPDYQAGDRLVLNEDLRLFALWRDSVPLGLSACSAGNGELHENILVPVNGSVTLRVDAQVSTGEIRYDWRSFDLDPSLLPDDSSNTFPIEKVDRNITVECIVRDIEGNAIYVSFAVLVDSGLRAWSADSGEMEDVRTVPLGGSVALRVDASVNAGELHFRWSDMDGTADSTLPEDDKTQTVTLTNVESARSLCCEVSDDYGNSAYVNFFIQVDTGLWAHIAGKDSQHDSFPVKIGESVTLSVEAGVELGELHYFWYSRSQYSELLPSDDETASVEIPIVERSAWVQCYVRDDYGGEIFLEFNIVADSGLQAFVAGTVTSDKTYWVDLGGSVTLAVDASVDQGDLHYFWSCEGVSPSELPSDDSTSSFTICDLERACLIYCFVEDDYGNMAPVTFQVYPDTGLKAWVEGNGQDSDYCSYEVPLGESLTLSIIAQTNGGNLHYRWECFEGEVPGLPTDDQTSSFIIQEVKSYAYLRCRVSDDLGARVDLYMEINVDNGLVAYAAGTRNRDAYYFDSSAPQTLTVEASANEGDLTYQWFKRAYGGNSVTVPGDGPSLFVGEDTKGSDYECKVTDIYGNSRLVSFYFRQGMAKELPFRTETTFESDLNTGELLISFTPEISGSYTLRTASEDPDAWYYMAGQNYDYWNGFPISLTLDAGKTYYFAIRSNGGSFTLHLTMERSGFRTFEELQTLLQQGTSENRLYYEGSEDPFVIPENLTIPAGVMVILENVGVEIAANAMLTVEENGFLLCDKLLVKGSVQNNGQINLSALTGGDKISYGEAGQTYLYLLPETEDELRSAVEQATANTDPHIQVGIGIENTDLTITRNLTIRAVTDLDIGKTVTVASGVTLELAEDENVSMYIYGDGQLRVQGTLRNNALIYLYETSSLVLEEAGVYSGEGIMQAYSGNGKAKDFFPWASLPEYSDYEISADGNWYFLTKKITAEPGDVNGDGSINSKDLILLRKLLVGMPAEDSIVAPDVNGDKSFNLLDLVRMRRLLAGMEAG